MRPRNVELERQLTEQAARNHCDPEPLIRHAETRAMRLSGEYVEDPMLVREDRDRPRDVREELADARNHLVWWMEDHIGDEEIQQDGLNALTAITVAYSCLREH